MTPEQCPNCGTDLPRRARVCPECGADERTGWSEQAAADHLGIHDPEAFDHEAFVREEFGEGRRGRVGKQPLWVWVVAAILLTALAAWWLF